MKRFIEKTAVNLMHLIVWILPFQLLRRKLVPGIENRQNDLSKELNEKDAGIVEIFVTLMLIFSFLFAIFNPIIQNNILLIILTILIFGRIIGIVIYHLHCLFIYTGKNRGLNRYIILALFNYFELIFWFASLYSIYSNSFFYNINIPSGISNITLYSFNGSTYFSIVTMTTLGYGDFTPIDTWGTFLISFQTLLGILIIVLVIGRVISSKIKNIKEN